jgi:cytochrome c oxidase subunit 2
MESFDPVTRQGLAITNLFNFELVVSGLLLLLVVGWLASSVVRFRARPDEVDEPLQVYGNARLELLWTVTPAVTLAVIFVLMIGTMRTVTASEPTAMDVRVIGHQWWWEYDFPGQEAVTANELHLPVGRSLLLNLGSVDVIHSFHVPQFGWMRDAVPGRTNQMSIWIVRPGQFDGVCNQYCGVQHAWMRTLVFADSPDQFDAWVAQQSRSVTPTGSSGEQVFLQNTCINCHTIRGLVTQGQVGPDLTHLGSRTTLGGGVAPNTPANLRLWIRDAGSYKPGVLMPPFPNLSEADLSALVDYLESLK